MQTTAIFQLAFKRIVDVQHSHSEINRWREHIIAMEFVLRYSSIPLIPGNWKESYWISV